MNDKKNQPCWVGWAERVEKLENLLCSYYTTNCQGGVE